MTRKNKGSLTVEASFALIVFIFAFLSILYLCKIARAQIVLQHAVNQIAKEISQYSYVTNKLGLRNDKSKSEKMIKDTDKMISETSDLISLINSEKNEWGSFIEENKNYEINDYYDAIKIYKKYDEAGNRIKDSYSKVDDINNFIGSAKEYLKDPKALLNGFVAIAKDEIVDFAVSKYIAAPLNNILVQKYLPKGQFTADEYLSKLGIEGGLEGLNFDTSTIFKNGSNIDITLIYNMSLKLPLFPERLMCFRVNASTVGWQSKLFRIEGDNEDAPLNKINIWDYDWKLRTYEFSKILMKEFGLSAVRTPLSLDFYDYSSNLYTYVHSMNTELKSYSTDGGLNLSSIKNQMKLYVKDALKDTNRTEKITMDDGLIYEGAGVKDKQDIKIIMVIKDTAASELEAFKKIAAEIKKDLNCNNLDIEFYFSDGIVSEES